PLPNGLHRTIVESSAQALQHLHVADRSIPADDDLENDVARDAAQPCLFCVIRLDFPQQPRRFDSASGSIRSAADSAARSRTDSRSGPFADAGSSPRPGAAAASGAVAVGFRLRLLEHADPI